MLYRILVPLDGSAVTECVLPHAVAIAKTFNGIITLAHVLEQPSESLHLPKADPLDWYLKKSAAKLYLSKIQTQLQENLVDSEVVILEGNAAEQIVKHAHAMRADLLIISNNCHNKSNTGAVSSNVQHILQHVWTSVLIVRTDGSTVDLPQDLRYQRMLVPLDGSQRAGAALTFVKAFARAYRPEILLAHVVARPEMPRHLPLTQEETELVNRMVECNREEGAKYLDQVRDQVHPTCETRLLVGDNVAATLQNLSEEENVDLLVLSAHGYSGESRWPYGSITNRFITHGTTPLLIVQDLQPDSFDERRTEDVATRQPDRVTHAV
ncbi:MAG: universal stress protein [Anaerolineae bacterium]|jgi:nucleotide-binding universal stress UspA family protein|nr:universal stress protein [Anaerolineae bacterium]